MVCQILLLNGSKIYKSFFGWKLARYNPNSPVHLRTNCLRTHNWFGTGLGQGIWTGSWYRWIIRFLKFHQNPTWVWCFLNISIFWPISCSFCGKITLILWSCPNFKSIFLNLFFRLLFHILRGTNKKELSPESEFFACSCITDSYLYRHAEKICRIGVGKVTGHLLFRSK